MKDYLTFLLSKALLIFSGPLVVLFLTNYLSPDDIGIYYAFIGIVGSSTLLELGFGIVLTNNLNYEYGKIEQTSFFPPSNSNVRQILSYSRSRYKNVANSWLSIVSLFSLVYLYYANILFPTYVFILFGLLVISYIGIRLYPILCFAEGFGKYRQTQLLKTLQSMTIGIVFSGSLMVSSSLGSMLLAYGVGLIVFYFGIRLWFSGFYHAYKSSSEVSTLNVELLRRMSSMSKQIGISWFSGYFSTLAIPPLLLLTFGPSKAGQYGIVNSVMMVMVAFSTVTASIHAPQASEFVLSNNRKELAKIVNKNLMIGIGSYAICFILFHLLYSYTPYISQVLNINIKVIEKIPDRNLTYFILLSGFAIVSATYWSIYLRGTLSEPFYKLSIYGSIYLLLTVGGSYLLSDYRLLIILIMGGRLFVFLPWQFLVYKRSISEWYDIKV